MVGAAMILIYAGYSRPTTGFRLTQAQRDNSYEALQDDEQEGPKQGEVFVPKITRTLAC